MQPNTARQAGVKGILALQRQAFESEAAFRRGAFNIPALRQTLQELEQEWRKGHVLIAVDATCAIIGCARTVTEETAYRGKLMVRADLQGRGIGTLLPAHHEKICSKPRLELFTSDNSLRNLKFYERAGYVRSKVEEQQSGPSLVYPEKIRPAC